MVVLSEAAACSNSFCSGLFYGFIADGCKTMPASGAVPEQVLSTVTDTRGAKPGTARRDTWPKSIVQEHFYATLHLAVKCQGVSATDKGLGIKGTASQVVQSALPTSNVCMEKCAERGGASPQQSSSQSSGLSSLNPGTHPAAEP